MLTEEKTDSKTYLLETLESAHLRSFAILSLTLHRFLNLEI